jgi:hypothetical protein
MGCFDVYCLLCGNPAIHDDFEEISKDYPEIRGQLLNLIKSING